MHLAFLTYKIKKKKRHETSMNKQLWQISFLFSLDFERLKLELTWAGLGNLGAVLAPTEYPLLHTGLLSSS